ncbi:hypothetical protein TNCV_4420511 [Trichonephila clavipes]|nr:hypothetical protein TNCV_4420511 [Trichonephila clavipes]
MVYCGISCQFYSIGQGHRHFLVDAVTFPSYPRHAILERDIVIWLTKEVFDKLHAFDDHEDTVASGIHRKTLYFPSQHDSKMVEQSTTVICLDSVQA